MNLLKIPIYKLRRSGNSYLHVSPQDLEKDGYRLKCTVSEGKHELWIKE